MSRVGKYPVKLPKGVSAAIENGALVVKGSKGELRRELTRFVKLDISAEEITVSPADESTKARAMWGTTRANVANMVTGVSQGFQKKLDIKGVGYRAAIRGNVLSIFLGFSHDIAYAIPQGITITAETQTSLLVSGIDKEKVGQVASDIRSLRKPEPYKGKGVRYADEFVRMKEGKKK